MANSSVKNLNIDGNVIISGSTTSIDVQQLTTDDNNITLNDITSPLDSNADGGGITVKGTTDKTFNWLNATGSWTASDHVDLATGKEYKIDTTSVLNATTLGAGVVNSSLTSIGTLTALQVDTTVIDGNVIGLTTDTDLITLTNNTVTVAGNITANTASPLGIITSREFVGSGTGITGISTANINSPGTAGQILYSDGATGWGGYTSVPLTAGGTGGTDAATARTSLGITGTGADTAYAFRANNLSDIASSQIARNNLGVGTTDSPKFGGEGTGSITIEATPSSSGTVAPTFAGTIFKSIPVASGSGHKWVFGTEQDGDLDFSYFTINDAGANTSVSETFMHFDATGTKFVSVGSASIQTWLSGLSYPISDGTANQVLTTDGATGLTFGTPLTTNITEGTKLFYTDARADARVTWTNLITRAGATGPAKINVGENAGLTSQGNNTVAVGKDAGKTSQGANAVAVGSGAGQISQVSEAVAVGAFAGNNGQGVSAVAVGNQAGQTSQGADAVAVGQYAGQTSQGIDAVAVGKEAGQTSQGSSAIAIGLKAGETNQGANSIVLSATGASFSPTTASAFFVNPVRNVAGTTYLQYNATTKEVTHIAATTSSVGEGTNLYYTDARADARIALQAGANLDLTSVTTTTLPEGTNLYYTDARADARATLRINAANLNTLADVHTAAPASGNVLAWDSGNSRWTPLVHTAVILNNDVNDTHIDWGTGANQVSTADIPESTNLFYTDARVDAYINASILTTDVSEGTNLYYTDARANTRADAQIGAASITALSDVTITTPATNALLQYNGSAWIDAIPTTAHITEGANLYYTDARADARIVNAGSANWNTSYTDTNAATEADTNSTLVKRGATGNVALSKVTANNGVVLGNNTGTTAGTVRWSGTDFQGYNGSAWVSLTSAAAAQVSGAVATFNTAQSTTSATYIDVPGYTSSITVTSSNIIQAQVTVDVGNDDLIGRHFIKLVRVIGGTPTDLFIEEVKPKASANRTGFNLTFADVHGQANGTVITYKLMYKANSGTVQINPNADPAQIFLYEITTSPINVSSVNGASGAVTLDTDDITEGSTNLYYTNTRADARIAAADTDDLSEGSTNLYYTNARADARVTAGFAANSTTNLSEGTNLYYTTARWDTKMAAADTDDLSEGTTNLYHQSDLGSIT